MAANKNLLILGAGQYGQVAKEVAETMGIFDDVAFLDDAQKFAVGKLNDYLNYAERFSFAFVAIGNVDLRLSYLSKLEQAGYQIATLISPKSFVSSSAQIGEGSIVEPMAVINANSILARSVFVCAGAIVNHNAMVGEGCQLDCGSVVAAGAELPPKTKLHCNRVFTRETLTKGDA